MRDTLSPVYAANLSMVAYLQQITQWKNSVLGTLCFSMEVECQADSEAPCMRIPMQRLDSPETSCDVWHGSGVVKQGHCGAIHYRQDDDVLFGVLVLTEPMERTDADKTPLQQTTESAYQQVFALLDQLRYPYLFRVWNYIADINVQSFGLERYQQFNLGRQDAFLAHGREIAGNVPAACALGFARRSSLPGSLSIAFLAGRTAPLSIENPRQISAYQYPRQYGPRSPTFSRASLVPLGQGEVLFISGTASIVGHASLHPADVAAQTRETMANIEAVLGQANHQAQRSNQTRFTLAALHYKVYVRRAADLQPIRAELERIVGAPLNAIYLQADVCRQDLLLEIEATTGHPFPLMPDPRS